MSRTRRRDKLTRKQGARDHQSCAPCWLCLTGKVAKRVMRSKPARQAEKQSIREAARE